MKKISEKKTGKKTVRIMVFGTFDILHPGHVHFFKQARRLSRNPFLIVSVARDINVKKQKGRKPLYKESARAGFVEKTGLADLVVLGAKGNHLPHILKHAPDMLALGYDQTGYYVESTIQYLQENAHNIRIVRLKSHRPEKYKSSIYKLNFQNKGS